MLVMSRDHLRQDSVYLVQQKRPFSVHPSRQPISTPSFYAQCWKGWGDTGQGATTSTIISCTYTRAEAPVRNVLGQGKHGSIQTLM